MNALEAVLDAIERGPKHVSATLLAFAVNKEVITLEDGRRISSGSSERPPDDL